MEYNSKWNIIKLQLESYDLGFFLTFKTNLKIQKKQKKQKINK